LIDELLGGGAGVLLISSELPEVIAMSDRIIVMRAGAIAGVLKPGEFSEATILRLAVLGEGSEAGPANGRAPAELTANQGVREA
jgi:ABC-type multidrug transport system ATPase subunit